MIGRNYSDYLAIFLLSAVITGLDFASKQAVLAWFQQGGGTIAITPFLNIVLAYNPGISFSMFTDVGVNQPLLLMGMTLVIMLGLSLWIMREIARLPPKANRWWHIMAAAGILGGGVGNLIDRWRWGAVVDFIDIYWRGYHWPAFNVSDSMITLAALALIIASWRSPAPMISATESAPNAPKD